MTLPDKATLWIIKACAFLALTICLWFHGYGKGKANGIEALDRHLAADAVLAVAASEDARKTEQAKAAVVATIGDKLEEDRTHAETVPAAVAAGLRNGNLKLRQHWAACETSRLSDSAASAVERDALAASRDEAAGRIVRIGRDSDDQLRACQAVVMADRK